MFFRFGSALALIVVIGLAAVRIEKRNLEVRRAITRQYFQTDVLLEERARLRLQTERLGSPEQLNRLEDSGAHFERSPTQEAAGMMRIEGRR